VRPRDAETTGLLGDIRALIETARRRVATTVNTELLMLNWHIGTRICRDILGQDLAAAILRELEQSLLELGTDFSFVARQKRITVDGEDYYLDPLFYHRRLKRMVALELKLGRFRAADKGQMELYLSWLDQHDRRPGEEPPLIGLILCAGKSSEHVKLLQFERSGIRVAEYMTGATGPRGAGAEAPRCYPGSP